MARATEVSPRRGGWAVGALVGLLSLGGVASCGGETSVGSRDAAPKPCTQDSDCPVGQSCSGGYCYAPNRPDGPADGLPGAQIVVTPTVLTFGNPYVGGEYTQSFTIRNVGQALLTVRQLDLVDNTQHKDFSLTAPPRPFTIDPDPQQVITVTVILRPSDNATPSGVVHVISDDPANADVPVQLAATVKDDASLNVCVLDGETVGDGGCACPEGDWCSEDRCCTAVSPPDDVRPLCLLGSIPYGESGSRVVALRNAGGGSVAEKVTSVTFVVTGQNPPPVDHYLLKLFELDGDGNEVTVTLPFYLNPVDPSGQVPQNELRARVTFDASDVDGKIEGVDLQIVSDHTVDPVVVPIVGQVLGCRPYVSDGGVAPDGGTDPLTDPNNCGYCGHRCDTDVPHATAQCVNGLCEVLQCEANWGDCLTDPLANPGCESDLLSSVGHCGACFHACVNLHGTTSCINGHCSPSCASGWDTCGGDPADGCTVSLNTAQNCGTCGHVCTNAHGGTSCPAGVCVPSCATGWGNCDGDADNGCETALNTATNCGSCGHACTNAHGSTACNNGTCEPSCSSGWGNCDGNPDNGCETGLSTVTNCGACGTACTNGHGTTTCTSGTCVPTCASGWGDCDSNSNNGCETSLGTTANCGGCGVTCSNPNGTTTCTSGTCVPTCSAGWGDCDSNSNNGCESALTTTTNCGSCGHACTNTHGTTTCTSGVCVPTCSSGYGNCDGDPDDGCETSLTTTTNCGSCGHACTNAHGTTTCTSGACVPTCSSGYGNCDGNPDNGCETSLNTTTNCGACGTTCTNNHGTTSCNSGTCVPACSSGWGDCDGNPNNGCETALTSVANCGGCGHVCANAHGTTTCSGGVCVPTCSSGYGDCDGNPDNGCESSLSTTTNCGSCGHTCTNAHGTTSCSGSTCVPSCSSGYGNCDGNADNGCETSLSTISDCGSCGHTCTNAHGTTSCVSGNCSPSCASLWGNCNGNPDDGCETALTSLSNCGSCGGSCSRSNASATCSTGTCQISSCNAGYYNVDGIDSNGCECQDTYTGNNACSSPVDLGTIGDNGASVTRASTLPFSGDEVWFRITASNSNYNAAAGNPYRVIIGFSTNPGSEFQLQVYTPNCSTQGGCDPGGSQPITATRPGDYYEWSASGEINCTSATGQVCVDHGTTYYVRVTRRSGFGVTCNSFTIKASNGAAP